MYQKKLNLSRTQKKTLNPKKITFNKSQNSKLKKDKQEPIKLENKFKINKIQKENKSKLYTLNSFINGTYLSCIISYTEKSSYPISTGSINILNLLEINFLSVNDNDRRHFI